MDNLTRFMEYAGAFELTYGDNDWSRLHDYFAADAVYAVESDSFACKLEGPQAIFTGINKSLDGFDRKFTARKIDLTSVPEIEGDEIRLGWKVTYEKDGLTPYVLLGRSRVRYRDGKIVELVDSYDPSATAAAMAWQQANGVALDPSYT